MLNNNTTLAELLYNVFPNIEQDYQRINSTASNTLNSIPSVINTINLTNDLISKIDAEIQNAQGQNP